MSLFKVGGHYPPIEHRERIKRYRDNERLFQGEHADVFKKVQDRLSERHGEIIYIAVNLPGLICKKSADFLFGETAVFSAGKQDDSPEQRAIERLVNDNDLHITNYESALSNAYRGDSFYKIRWGQTYNGFLGESTDPFRAIIEAQNAEYVFPETIPGDANRILAYHIAHPVKVEDRRGDRWVLQVESHYPGEIRYAKFEIQPSRIGPNNVVEEWIIVSELDADEPVQTGVPFPLVVHIPNYSTDSSWHGIDDLSEHAAIFDEINNRLSQISSILDKHADPALMVPPGTLQTGEDGSPEFRVSVNKVFEVGEEDGEVKYITWDGQLEAAFKELERLVDLLLTVAELPAVALGKDNAGTSGASGLSIKWRMNSLLAKINRKRQYYDKGLRNVLYIAQLLEHAQSGEKLDYKPTWPKINFKDGLPDDEMEQAQIAQIRTGGRPTMSQKTALMRLDGLTEQQAEAELERIREDEMRETAVDSSIFNKSGGGDS
jgi:hypothetical protein